MGKFLTESENLLDLVSHMPDNYRVEWLKFGHLELVPAFLGRVFIMYMVYKDEHDQYRPFIHDYITAVDIEFNSAFGVMVKLESRDTGKQLITTVPSRVCGYPVYASIPTRCEIRQDAQMRDGRVQRSFTFPILIKTINKPVFRNVGNTYMLTPNKFKELFPLEEVELCGN